MKCIELIVLNTVLIFNRSERAITNFGRSICQHILTFSQLIEPND